MSGVLGTESIQLLLDIRNHRASSRRYSRRLVSVHQLVELVSADRPRPLRIASVRSGEGGDGVDVEPPPVSAWRFLTTGHAARRPARRPGVSVRLRDLGWALSAAGGLLAMGGPRRARLGCRAVRPRRTAGRTQNLNRVANAMPALTRISAPASRPLGGPSGEFEMELPSAPPGHGGVGREVGVAQDG